MSGNGIIVLKFGSSVLPGDGALLRAVQEIYREVREGRRVVAVVSAFEGRTDALLARARELAPRGRPEAVAALLATGEAEAASAVTLAAHHAGIPARGLSAEDLDLRTAGPPLDAIPLGADAHRIRTLLGTTPVVVVPGFVGRDATGRPTLLGRGGSDLTALVLAHGLGARCRLLKDVDGWFEDDPARSGEPPRRYAALRFEDALDVPAPIVQGKAVLFARSVGHAFEVGALGSVAPTLVGASSTSTVRAERPPRPLRVTLLGLGTVGREVAARLRRHPGFEVVAALVRDGAATRGDAPPFTTADPEAALAVEASVVVDLLPGIAPARGLVEASLRSGRSVVTANKALLAAHGRGLERLAAEGGASLLASAAVGGAVPMLETVARLAAEGGVRSLRGVLNGTCNFVLDALAGGRSLGEAAAEALRLGFAEADPRRDLSGQDAADKLVLLCRRAFGKEPDRLDVAGIDGDLPGWAPPRVLRLVAEATASGTELAARVGPLALDPDDPLAHARGEENVLEVRPASGPGTVVRGAGAGGGPATTAVLADLEDLRRRAHAASRLEARP